METGYDSYWMYQNSRPEPLHNLQNKDQYSYAVFTDSNKQVQNRTSPRHYNNCMQPPNNVAYYNQSSQYRTSDYKQMWPSSVYSVPFKPSYVNNTQPRRASVNWSSSSGYLPQNSYTHENLSVRYSQNHFSQVSSSKNKSNSRFNPAPASCHIQQISRIRVKDVYSINNNPVSDPLLNKTFLQTHSKRQSESVINCMLNNDGAIELNQTKFFDNSHLPQPTPPPPYYRHSASEQPQQSHSQFGSSKPSIIVSANNTLGFIPQEIHPSKVNHNPEMQKVPREFFDASHRSDNMLPRAHANEKVSENTNSGQLGSVQTSDRITLGIFNTTSKSQIQNCRLNELESTAHFETLNSSKTSAYGTYGMSNSSHVPTIPVCHKNVSENGGANLASFTSPKVPRTNLNSQVSANPETSSYDQSQEGTLIKISIPHTGQSSFIRLNDSNSKSICSNLSLPCLLESNNVFFNSVTRDLSDNINERIYSSVLETATSEKRGNSPLTSVESHQNSDSSLLSNSSPFRKVLNPKQSFINANKENVNNFVSNSLPQNDLTSKTGITNVSEVPAPEKDIKLNLKQDDRIISGNNELNRIIQKEKIPVEETLEDNSAQFSENLKNLEKSSPALDETENSDSTEVRTFPKKSEDIPSEKPEPESKSLRNSVPNGRKLKKRVHQRRRYKSKINRVKLNMLIQFLERDDEPVRASLETPCEKTTSEDIKCRNDEKRRRRKLSKTCIVKNRNISREMELLMSYKTSRVDPSKSSSETSHTVKSNVDSQKGKEGKGDFAETGGNIKTENSTSSSEHQPQKEDSLQSERNNTNELVTGEVQEPAFKCSPDEKDKEIINMMRILRTMTTNFCMNCNLSSSADSFWVNAVSFELRCLNCFKKFILKEFKTKNCGYDPGKQEVNSGNENNLKDVDSPNYFSESANSNSKEIQQEKPNNLKEENLTAKLPEDSPKGRRESFEKSKMKNSLKEGGTSEERQSSEENVSFGKIKNSILPKAIREKSERKSSSTEESADEDSSKKSILKNQHVDNGSRTSGNECKSGKLLRSPSKEMEDKKDIPKKEKKRNVDTPKRKTSTESTPNKTSVPNELPNKEGIRLMDSPAESTKKAKGFQERPKGQPKISKHGQPEMSEMSQIPSKSKEISSTDEPKSKSGSSDSEEKKSLKRKHDDRLPVNKDKKREKERKLFTGKIPKTLNFGQRLRKTVGKRWTTSKTNGI